MTFLSRSCGPFWPALLSIRLLLSLRLTHFMKQYIVHENQTKNSKLLMLINVYRISNGWNQLESQSIIVKNT